MSDRFLVGRTLTDGILGQLMGTGSPGRHAEPMSRGYEALAMNVFRAKSEHEEAEVVRRELETLKINLAKPNCSVSQMRDYLCRVVYCHLLGYDVEFACIYGVKLAQQGTLVEKKTGYLVCSVLLHRNHELILLLVNTIQKDLKSSNLLDNIAALCAASHLLPAEMIPSVLSLVMAKLKHDRGFVRQKAVMCLYQFQLLAPDLLRHCQGEVEGMLGDKDPGVVAAVIHVIYQGIQVEPERYVALADSLITILKQLVCHKLSSVFDYHNIQMPWLQINIIKCLARLSLVDTGLKAKTVAIMLLILKQVNLKEDISYAIMYECIYCMIYVKADRPHLDVAVQHVHRFLHSSDPTLKFIGIKLLVMLVEVDPQYATNYQDMIVQALDNPDTTIQRKMYSVLYGIAREANVQVVCKKLLQQLHVTTDTFWKEELVTMATNLIIKFEVNPNWQIDTLFTILESGQEYYITNKVIHFLSTKFTHPTVEEKQRQYVVQKCVSGLINGNTSPALLHICVWALGELCPLLKNKDDVKVIGLFTKLLSDLTLPYPVYSSVITSLQKLIVNDVVGHDSMVQEIDKVLQLDLSVVVKQRLSVLRGVCRKKLRVTEINNDALDTTLCILDDLVSERLAAGAKSYIAPHLRKSQHASEKASSTETTLREELFPGNDDDDDVQFNGRDRTTSTTSSSKTETDREGAEFIPSSVKRVWGREGRIEDQADTKHNTSTQVLSEEDQQQKELAKALFAGLQPNTQAKKVIVPSLGGFEEDEEASSQLPRSSGRWSNIHQSMTGEPMTTTSSAAATSPTTTPNILTPSSSASSLSTKPDTETNPDFLPAEFGNAATDVSTVLLNSKTSSTISTSSFNANMTDSPTDKPIPSSLTQSVPKSIEQNAEILEHEIKRSGNLLNDGAEEILVDNAEDGFTGISASGENSELDFDDMLSALLDKVSVDSVNLLENTNLAEKIESSVKVTETETDAGDLGLSDKLVDLNDGATIGVSEGNETQTELNNITEADHRINKGDENGTSGLTEDMDVKLKPVLVDESFNKIPDSKPSTSIYKEESSLYSDSE